MIKISAWDAGWNVTNAIQGMFVLSLPFAIRSRLYNPLELTATKLPSDEQNFAKVKPIKDMGVIWDSFLLLELLLFVVILEKYWSIVCTKKILTRKNIV